jgi:hypothetical protein
LFWRSERDKQQASEDAQWSEAVKTVSQSAKLSPIAITLNPFLTSKRYDHVAKRTAVQALISTRDVTIFADLFKGAFVPMDWANFDTVLQLDRALSPRLNPLLEKAWNKEDQFTDMSRLSASEKEDYEYIMTVLKDIGAAMPPLLKGSRPPGQVVDLRSAWFYYCDWSGVNLYEANIENIVVRRVSLKGADLGGITSFDNADFYCTAWWDANRISPELLQYLIAKWPCGPNVLYGPNENTNVPPEHYKDSIARLMTGK